MVSGARIHYSSNLGQTGSCYFSEASLFHCSREPDRPPHMTGKEQVGAGRKAPWSLASRLLLIATHLCSHNTNSPILFDYSL